MSKEKFEPRFPTFMPEGHPNPVVREICVEINRAERQLFHSLYQANARNGQLMDVLRSGLTFNPRLVDYGQAIVDVTAAMARRAVGYDLLLSALGTERFEAFMNQHPVKELPSD